MERPPAKLLDRIRYRIRVKGYSIRTEKSYVDWARRFILFHNKRHPQNMGKDEIEAYLTHWQSNGMFHPLPKIRLSTLCCFFTEMCLKLSSLKILMRIAQNGPPAYRLY